MNKKRYLYAEDNALRAMAKKNHEKHLTRCVHLGNKANIDLDITYSELEEYRKNHQVCEICGKPERAITSSKGNVSRLAIDHQHGTNHFRGLLCMQCNIGLGYYEKYKEQIESYLKRNKDT